MKIVFAGWILAAVTSCSDVTVNDETPKQTNGEPIAIVDVNVIPMDRERIMESQTVVIQDGRITAIGTRSDVQTPAGATVIDGKGKYLLPGLIDMHVHIRSAELSDYLPAGVTAVRNMWGYDELPATIQAMEAGTKSGPRIFSLTAGFDGSPAVWPQTQISDNPAAIRALVDRQYALGFREIKVYQKLTRVAYDTIVAIAKEKGMTFAGHMPPLVGLEHVLASGQRSIEHLGGYSSGSQLDAQIAATVAAGTYNCPTLGIYKILNGASSIVPRKSIVLAMSKNGARLLVGTDSGIDKTEPGSSIHDELALFVEAGLTPYQALLGATRTAAEYLGQSSSIGGVAVGMSGDLLMVRSNPLTNIGATQEIEAVISRGKRVR
jgi:imidazolonepropionase-like amidohydrolase